MYCLLFTDKIFDISAFTISAQFWPTFNKESLELPKEIANEFEKYTKAYEAYKGNRTLNWRTVTGRVNILIEIGQRIIEMTVAPTHAIILYHFQDKGEFFVIFHHAYLIRLQEFQEKNVRVSTKMNRENYDILFHKPLNRFFCFVQL